MRLTLALAALLAATATAAAAEPRTITRTIDRPSYSFDRTAVIDRTAGTVARTSNALRKSDGATATATKTITRTDTGLVSQGSATSFAGQSYTSQGSVVRTDADVTRTKTITNGAGVTVFNRSSTRTRRPAGD